MNVKHQSWLTAQDFVLKWFIQLSIPGLQPLYFGIKKALKQNLYCIKALSSLMVPGTGIEPVRYCYRRILSPVRLPVPPPGHQNGDSLENRTPDPVIKSHVLYQLS